MSRKIIRVPADSTLFGASAAGVEQYGYAPAVRAGNLLFISGLIGRDADGAIPTDVKEQVDLVFQRTLEILRWVGLDRNDLVDIDSYHVDLPNNLDRFLEIEKQYLSPDFPAWTALGVAALALPELKIEMRSVAVFPD